MPRTYRAKQSGVFGTDAYPDTSPEIDVAGAIGAITQAIATTREALIMREQMRAQAKRQSMMDAFMMERARKQDQLAEAQERREGARDVREQAREDRAAAADVEDQRFKRAERSAKGYVEGGVKALPGAGSSMGGMPAIELAYQAPHIDPERTSEARTKSAERQRKRTAYGQSGKIPTAILDAAVEDDAIARSYLENPASRASRSRDPDQEQEEDIERAFRAVGTQVDDARGRVAVAKEKLPKRDGDLVPLQRPRREDYNSETEYNRQAGADSTYRADSARAMVPYRRETARLDSLLSVQGALAARMQGKEPSPDFSGVRGGSSSAPAPKADFSKVRGGSSASPKPTPKPVSSDTTKQTRAAMLQKAKAAYEAGPQTSDRKARYDRAVARITAQYPR